MYRKYKKLSRTFQRGYSPQNLSVELSTLQLQFTIYIFFQTDVLRRLFDTGFSYKHCNFTRACLPVKMASKTVIRPIVSLVRTSLVNEPGKCVKTIAVVYELPKRTQEKLFADQTQSIFCAQSGAGIRLNVWKQFDESRYLGALPLLLENFRPAFFPDPTDCPWVSKDACKRTQQLPNLLGQQCWQLLLLFECLVLH